MRETFDLIRTRKIWDLGLLSLQCTYYSKENFIYFVKEQVILERV